MTLPKPFSWTREEARSGKFDGKFLIGVRTTGIYCLPSCPTHPPKPENVTLFRTEAECLAAGLRACKRCRPDLYYRGEDENIALFEGLAARVARRHRSAFAEPPPWRGPPASARPSWPSCSAPTPIWRRPNGCGASGCARRRARFSGATRWSISASAPALKANRSFTASSRPIPA